MVTLEQVRRLRENFPTCSWAIWNDAGADSVQFFGDNVARLKNDVVFVGLNRSGVARDWTNNFQNFHTPKHRGDAALKRLIQGENLTRLIGGYMTDVSDVFETNSGKVELDVDASGARLEEQLDILGAPRADIICFGHDVFRGLLAYYGLAPLEQNGLECAHTEGRTPRSLFRVFHYSPNGFNTKNVRDKLPGQLMTLNSLKEAR